MEILYTEDVLTESDSTGGIGECDVFNGRCRMVQMNGYVASSDHDMLYNVGGVVDGWASLTSSA